jgi:hypothetical protein
VSLLVFPSTLAGVAAEVSRTPVYDTKVQTSVSGKELRASYQSTPRYRYELKFNFIRKVRPGGGSDLTDLITFFETHRGRWDDFLYVDPYTTLQVRVRFDMDALDFKQWMDPNVWDNGGVIKLISVK